MGTWLRRPPWRELIFISVWTAGCFTVGERAPVVGSLMGGSDHTWWYDFLGLTAYWFVVWSAYVGFSAWRKRRSRPIAAELPR